MIIIINSKESIERCRAATDITTIVTTVVIIPIHISVMAAIVTLLTTVKTLVSRTIAQGDTYHLATITTTMTMSQT